MESTYDRYAKFRNNGQVSMVPFIPIPVRDTDYYESFILGKTRLDILSYNYYGNPDYGWLILQANPQYGANEFSIPDKARLRIPYPLGTVLEGYKSDIDTHMRLYGKNA
jgi:hypothetical protein